MPAEHDKASPDAPAPVRVHSYFRAQVGGIPAWTCDVDGQKAPCPTKQGQLLEDFKHDRDGLLQVMAEWHAKATVDLPDADPRELDRQFFGWIPKAA